jgi:hypothetical protein
VEKFLSKAGFTVESESLPVPSEEALADDGANQM